MLELILISLLGFKRTQQDADRLALGSFRTSVISEHTYCGRWRIDRHTDFRYSTLHEVDIRATTADEVKAVLVRTYSDAHGWKWALDHHIDDPENHFADWFPGYTATRGTFVIFISPTTERLAREKGTWRVSWSRDYLSAPEIC
jgi:hypothetical protein